MRISLRILYLAKANCLHKEMVKVYNICRHLLNTSTSDGIGSLNDVNRSSGLEHFFKDHVRACSMQNWKYWTFSQLMGPLLKSFEK